MLIKEKIITRRLAKKIIAEEIKYTGPKIQDHKKLTKLVQKLKRMGLDEDQDFSIEKRGNSIIISIDSDIYSSHVKNLIEDEYKLRVASKGSRILAFIPDVMGVKRFVQKIKSPKIKDYANALVDWTIGPSRGYDRPDPREFGLSISAVRRLEKELDKFGISI